MNIDPKIRELKFILDGIEVGSANLIVHDRKVLTENAEEEFYAILRKNEKSIIEDVENEERENIIDNLTKDQETILKDIHAKDYTGLDDDMADDYEDWLMDLSLEDLRKYLKDDSGVDLEIKSIREENLWTK